MWEGEIEQPVKGKGVTESDHTSSSPTVSSSAAPIPNKVGGDARGKVGKAVPSLLGHGTGVSTSYSVGGKRERLVELLPLCWLLGWFKRESGS